MNMEELEGYTEEEVQEQASARTGAARAPKVSGASVKGVLEGSLIAEKVRRNMWYVLFVTVLGIVYISNGYSMEKLHRERAELERRVSDLRFESITAAADLMFMRKQSEVIKRIKKEGLTLEESKEPPMKLYR